MQYILLLIIVMCGLGNNIFKNRFAKGEICSDGDNALYNVIACGIGAPLSLVGYGFSHTSPVTILIALCFGISMAGVAITTIKALQSGPMALTVLFGNFSMMIPILVGFFLWHEEVTAAKVIGIFIMFAAIELIIDPGKDAAVKDAQAKTLHMSKIWAVYTLLYFMTCGLMAVFQQMQSKSVTEESAMFLFWGFSFATLTLIVYTLFCQRRKKTRVQMKLLSRQTVSALVVGIFGAISHICGLKILTMMDSTVFYPLKDGICIICNALLGIYMFRETIRKRQAMGFVIGFAAIIMLTIVRSA